MSFRTGSGECRDAPPLFALDANVWVKEALLRSGAGAHFLYVLRRLGGRILLPDVTAIEIAEVCAARGLEAATRVCQGLSTIRWLVGKAPEVWLPAGQDMRAAVDDRLGQLSAVLLRSDSPRDRFARALRRVVERVAPAASDEEYRDCLLWEAVVDHSGQGIGLISEDKHFRGQGGGLSPDLQRESAGRVLYWSSLADSLRSIDTEALDLDRGAIAIAVADLVRAAVRGFADNRAFAVGDLASHELHLFVTEDIDRLLVTFEIRFEASGVPMPDGSVVRRALAVAEGECAWTEFGGAEHLQIRSLIACSESGERLPYGTIFGGPVAMGGNSTRVYAVREPWR